MNFDRAVPVPLHAPRTVLRISFQPLEGIYFASCILETAMRSYSRAHMFSFDRAAVISQPRHDGCHGIHPRLM